MWTLVGEIRFALRQFRKSPVFALTVLVVLALGVGATTSLFTLFDQVLLRSLPVEKPQELVRMQGTGSFSGRTSTHGGDTSEYFSYPAYQYLRDHNQVFSGVIAYDGPQQVGVGWQGQTELLQSELVSGNYFNVLGVRPAVGRLLSQEDDRVKNADPVTVLSYGYWERHFGGDPKVVGQSLLVNGRLFTILGVAAPNFHSVIAGNAPDLFFPMMMKPVITPDWDDLENHRSLWLNIVGRLKPGISIEQAQAAMEPVWHALRSDEMKYYQQNTSANFLKGFVTNSHLRLLPGGTGFSEERDDLTAPLSVLLGLAGLMLLMACANVASLLLVRAAGRVREISVRYALGAKRGQIVRQLLIEGLLLGLVGGALGVTLARPIAAFLIPRMQGASAGRSSYSAAPDGNILLFSLGLTVAVSLLFSLAPALQFWRPEVATALKQQTAASAGGSPRLRRLFVGLQLGISVLLLAVSGLFIRTLENLRSVRLGFAPDHLVGFSVDPRMAGYQAAQVYGLDRRILGVLRALPGVRAAGATNDPELTGDNTYNRLEVPGYKPHQQNEMQTETSAVDAGYFAAMGIPVLAGRGIAESDGKDSQLIGVVSRNFAEHFFGSAEKALGRSFKIGSGGQGPAYTIVGVVGNTRHANTRDPAPRRIFVSYLQQPPSGMAFYVRTDQAPQQSLNGIRAAMREVDPKLALDSLQTMDAQVDTSLDQERTLALLATAFGGLAIAMAAIGLYGVLAYATAQRTREIGVRMAIGATRLDVARMVLREVLWLAAVSIALALPATWVLGRAAKSLLYGVGSADPLVLAGTVLLVVLVAGLAAAIPARRAAGVEPMEALRYE